LGEQRELENTGKRRKRRKMMMMRRKRRKMREKLIRRVLRSSNHSTLSQSGDSHLRSEVNKFSGWS